MNKEIRIRIGEYLAVIDYIDENNMKFIIPNIGYIQTKNNDEYSEIKLSNLLSAFNINPHNLSLSKMTNKARRLYGKPVKVICRGDRNGRIVDIHEFESLEIIVDSIYI